MHRRGPARPRIMHEISELICRMAQENPAWGYMQIQDQYEQGCTAKANFLILANSPPTRSMPFSLRASSRTPAFLVERGHIFVQRRVRAIFEDV